MIHCQSQQVARVKESDLPVLYFYQGCGNTILFCEMYEEEAREKHFPNSDFEVAKVYGERGELLLLELSCRGEALKVLRSFIDQEARDVLAIMSLPNDNFVLMEGTIDNLTKAVPKELLSGE